MFADQEDAAYQWMLRAIGAYLDERAAGDVCVIETPEGFAFRWEGGKCSAGPGEIRLRCNGHL